MRRPAQPLPGGSATTTLRVSPETVDALDWIRCYVTDWMLASTEPEVRIEALTLTNDQVLRLVLATFARDYRIALRSNIHDSER